MSKLRLLLASGSVLALSVTSEGCSAKSSSDVATNQIQPFYSVIVETYPGGENTYIGAIFGQNNGSLADIRLDSGDTITATTDKDASLALGYDSGLQVYSINLKGATDRSNITFNLNRPGNTSAPNSTSPLTPAVALTAPVAMATVSYAAGPLAMTWTNPVQGANMTIVAFPSCDQSAFQATSLTTTGPDTGTISVPAANLLVSAPTDAAGQCILLRIIRELNGTIDPAFDIGSGSKFTVDRYDYVKITVTP